MNIKTKRVKIVWIASGPVMLSKEKSPVFLKFQTLSKQFYGDIITPVMDKKYLSVKKAADFNIHSFPFYHGNPIIRNISYVFNMLIRILALKIKSKEKPQIIISPNPLLGGAFAILSKWIIGCKAVIEINGCFESSLDFHETKRSLIDKVQKKISRTLIRFSITNADVVKLLFPEQIDAFKKKRDKINTSVFHDYVQVSDIVKLPTADKKYILIMGYPWYLKGVDVLIKAFNRISEKYPEYGLKVIGWCPTQKEFFEKIADGNEQIYLGGAVGTNEALKLISECSIFVLASRTEAMGRVFLEAMACKKPIVGSNVDGIPFIIKDGFNGFLFESENDKELSEKLDLILSDNKLYKKLSENGYNYVQNELSDLRYIEKYSQMVHSIL